MLKLLQRLMLTTLPLLTVVLFTGQTASARALTTFGPHKAATPAGVGGIDFNEFWAGYVAGSGSGNGFKAALGQFNVPCTSGPYGSQYGHAAWVGLGGFFPYNQPPEEPLVQAGIEIDSSGHYHAFYEYVPKGSNGPGPVISPQTFDCGDHVSVTAAFLASGIWDVEVLITDGSESYEDLAPANYFTHLGAPSHMQSAEWVDELPVVQSNLVNFHYMNWSGAAAMPNYTGASYGPVGSFEHTTEILQCTTNLLAQPTALGSDNESWRDNWYNSLCD